MSHLRLQHMASDGYVYFRVLEIQLIPISRTRVYLGIRIVQRNLTTEECRDEWNIDISSQNSAGEENSSQNRVGEENSSQNRVGEENSSQNRVGEENSSHNLGGKDNSFHNAGDSNTNNPFTWGVEVSDVGDIIVKDDQGTKYFAMNCWWDGTHSLNTLLFLKTDSGTLKYRTIQKEDVVNPTIIVPGCYFHKLYWRKSYINLCWDL